MDFSLDMEFLPVSSLHLSCQVAVCDEQQFTDQRREEMSVAQFIHGCRWQAHGGARGQGHRRESSTMQPEEAAQRRDEGIQGRGREEGDEQQASRRGDGGRQGGGERSEDGQDDSEERGRESGCVHSEHEGEERDGSGGMGGRRGAGGEGEGAGAQPEGPSRLLYLKDWHFVQASAEGKGFMLRGAWQTAVSCLTV